MSITGHPKFLAATKDRPQAVQQTLKPILERIKGNCGSKKDDDEPKEDKKKKKDEPKEEEAP